MKFKILHVALTFALGSAANAATFTEGTGPDDFAADAGVEIRTTADVGVLGEGTHTFSGSVECVSLTSSFCRFAGQDYADAWEFDIASGFELLSVVADVDLEDQLAAEGVLVSLYRPGPSPLFVRDQVLYSDGQSVELAPSIIGAGAGFVLLTFVFDRSPEDNDYTAAYTYTVKIGAVPAIVPLPAPALLLLGGFGGLAALRRRRSSA